MKAMCGQCQTLFNEYATAKMDHHNLEFELRCLEQENNTWQISSVKPQVENALRTMRARQDAFRQHQKSAHGITSDD
jgi:hypothetical protein